MVNTHTRSFQDGTGMNIDLPRIYLPLGRRSKVWMTYLNKIMEARKPCLLADTSDIFSSFAVALKNQLDQLNVELKSQKEEQHIVNYDSNHHWKKIDLCFQALSKECTKLAVLFSKPPLPSEQERNSLLNCVIEAIDMLKAWSHAFPISQGKYVTLKLRRTVFDVLECVGDLVSSVKTDGCSESPQRLHLTGKIWNLCESFEKLPKDDKSAALLQLSESYQLVSDALGEIEQEIKDADEMNDDDYDAFDDDEQWTLNDRKCFPHCLGLIKTAKGTLKRLRTNISSKGSVTSSTCIDELDRTVDSTEKLSSCVDEMILSMYAPIDTRALFDNATLLSKTISSSVETVRGCHFIEDKDSPSLDFLQKAINHNLTNLAAVLQIDIEPTSLHLDSSQAT